MGSTTVYAGLRPATATIQNTTTYDSARAAVSSFGAELSLGGNTFEQRVFDLDEPSDDGLYNHKLHDLGGNECLPSASPHKCVAGSANLAPPEPL